MNIRSQLLAGAFLATGLSACNQNASGEPPKHGIDVPDVAHTREDVELIIHAYLLENPEIVQEVMVILEEREKSEISNRLSSDDRDPSYGPKDAPITIVEYFDYNCGYCKRSVDWVLEQVDEGDGQVRVIFKELPILTEGSRRAATAAIAAKKQGKYLEFHRLLMVQKAGTLSSERIDELAESIGLNVTRLHKDMESSETRDHILDIRDEAITHGATSTPSFFVNGELIQGYDQTALEARLKELKANIN